MASVIQIVRSSGLSATSGPSCRSVGEPLAMQMTKRSSRLLATPQAWLWELLGARHSPTLQVAQELPRLLATSTPSLLGRTGYTSFFLKRQPCVFNIPGFPSAVCEHRTFVLPAYRYIMAILNLWVATPSGLK